VNPALQISTAIECNLLNEMAGYHATLN